MRFSPNQLYSSVLIAAFLFPLCQASATPQSQEPDYTPYKSFEFIPGEQTLFFDDFSRGLSSWTSREWDIYEPRQAGRVTTFPNAPGSWFHLPRKGQMRPNGVKVLPNNFTLEYDLITDENVTEHESGILNIFVKAEGLSLEDYSYHFSDTPQIKLDIKPYSQNLVVSAFRESGFTGGIEETSCIFQETRANFWTPSKVHRVSISRIGTRLVAYVNQTKVFDIANALPPNVGYTLLMATDLWETGFYVSNLRLATDAKLPATELKERQTYFTENILFGTDSDRINPRSYQTIRRIAQALKEVDGKIKIIGHTDNTGKAEYNMELSKKRAESVKRTLVREFGIEASRIETEGKGQTEPIGSNDTVQGRAANRRVEFRIVK